MVRSPRWRALCLCLVSQAVEDLWPEVVEGFFPWFTFNTESSNLKQNKIVLAISGPGRLGHSNESDSNASMVGGGNHGCRGVSFVIRL